MLLFPVAVAPSEHNIRLLTDMGFSRARAVNALRRTGDNVETATTFLLQEDPEEVAAAERDGDSSGGASSQEEEDAGDMRGQ